MTFQKSPPGSQMTFVLLGKGIGRGELTFKIDSYLRSLKIPTRDFYKTPSLFPAEKSTMGLRPQQHLQPPTRQAPTSYKLQTGFISSISGVK